MKAVLFFVSILSILILNSCNQKTDTRAILENPKSRAEIFDSIANNQKYMTEFIIKIHGHEMMMGGSEMQMMMNDSLMNKNSMNGTMINAEMMRSMMDGMIDDSITMAAMIQMIQMMQQRGIMSEDCMQASMKMMGNNEKGMMHNTTK
jgi:hypothetical protein